MEDRYKVWCYANVGKLQPLIHLEGECYFGFYEYDQGQYEGTEILDIQPHDCECNCIPFLNVRQLGNIAIVDSEKTSGIGFTMVNGEIYPEDGKTWQDVIDFAS